MGVLAAWAAAIRSVPEASSAVASHHHSRGVPSELLDRYTRSDVNEEIQTY
jgi:hypothetical protein